MKLWSHYHLAESVDDALAVLAAYDGHAQILAGGTDLLLDIQQGNQPPAEALVDITRISELTAFSAADGMATLGAGMTHSAIVATPALRKGATCLVESCGVVGGPQVRNVATLGGNVAHALPAADGTLSLVALRAQAEIATPGGRRWMEMSELFLGPGKSTADPCRELLTRFRLRLAAPGEASAFKRIMRPQGVALPILGCAVWIRLDETRTQFAEASICLGPVFPTPMRATEVEAELAGQSAGKETIARVVARAQTLLHPRTSKYRATAEYRTDLIAVLLRDSLELALQRAMTGESVPQGVE